MDEGNEGDMMAGQYQHQTTIDVEVRGLVELQNKLEQMWSDLNGTPILNAMRDCTLMVERDAKLNLSEPYPAGAVDTGRLRASIWPTIKFDGNIIQGIVGSNLKYAAAVEYGSKPHMPPVEPLIGWVRRKGLAGTYSTRTRRRLGNKEDQGQQDRALAWAIAMKIKRVGTKAHPFLEPAYKKNELAIRRRFEHTVEIIVNK